MKKSGLFCLLCAALLLSVLVCGGCGGQEPEATEPVTEAETEPLYMGERQVKYETASVTEVGGTLRLIALFPGERTVWESADTAVATVAQDGTVTGVGAGYTAVTARAGGNAFTFGVTVLDESTPAVIRQICDANNANIFVRKHLGIGAGGPEYYTDVVGSVSKLLFNKPLSVDTRFEAQAAKNNSNHGGKMERVEFICVHYTGNMREGATAAANAEYFATNSGEASIHYVTGNDGVFSVLSDDVVGWHAGDGTGTPFVWYRSGVMAQPGDPQFPEFGISERSHFTVNGEESRIVVPGGDTAETRRVTGDTFLYKGEELPCINRMGLAFKIENGEYYLGTAWWCYSQTRGGRICNHGGNNNSIGIESAVNKGTDLWLTWQMTAQLTARLMESNNLDITRVVGHHFFTAKDCPQPMLENDLEIWNEFRELVLAENAMQTVFGNYEITMEPAEGQGLSDTGRVQGLSKDPRLLTYTVTAKDKNHPENAYSVTLSAVCPGK